MDTSNNAALGKARRPGSETTIEETFYPEDINMNPAYGGVRGMAPLPGQPRPPKPQGPDEMPADSAMGPIPGQPGTPMEPLGPDGIPMMGPSDGGMAGRVFTPGQGWRKGPPRA